MTDVRNIQINMTDKLIATPYQMYRLALSTLITIPQQNATKSHSLVNYLFKMTSKRTQ